MKNKKHNKVSPSSFLVLKVYLKKSTDKLFSDLFDKSLHAVTEQCYQKVKKHFPLSIYKILPVSILSRLLDFFALEGLSDHYVLRKNFIHEVSSNAVKEGFEQVVNLAAGYDCLCLKIAKENNAVNCFELDRSFSVDLKSELADELAIKNFFNTRFDFNIDSIAELENKMTSFDYTKKTIFIFEGIFVYLEEAVIRKIFKELKLIAEPGSLVVFTNVEPYIADKKEKVFGIKNMMKGMSEEMNFVSSEKELENLLLEYGFKIKENRKYLNLQDEFVTGSFSSKYRSNYVENIYLAELSA